MVQRTSAPQAEGVWRSVVAAFPRPKRLTADDRASLEQLMAPLGLRWRIQNIIRAVETLARAPNQDVRSIAGVGPYITASIEMIAQRRRTPVIDSNVVRVYSRFLGTEANDGTRRNRAFRIMSAAMLPRSRTRDYNWAILDLGATVCTPRAPKCAGCPLEPRCASRAKSTENPN